jgi:SPOR domain
MNGKIAWTDDNFSDGRDRSTRAGRSRFGIARLPIAGVVIAGLVAAAVVGGIVTWLVSGDDRMAANSPPLIKADDKPIKVHPDSPGGLDVPNRDKLVYSRLKEGGEAAGDVERLSPVPEEPLAPPTMLAKPASPGVEPPAPASSLSPTGNPFPSGTVGSIDTPRISEPAPAAEPEAPAEAPVAVLKPVPEAPATKPAVQAEKPAAGKPVAEPPATTKRDAGRETAKGGGKVYVQLLASRSQSDALGAWKKLQTKNGDLLGDLDSSIARADLGERGVFYRLRAGPIASEARAKSLCSALAGRKVSCLIVRSGA